MTDVNDWTLKICIGWSIEFGVAGVIVLTELRFNASHYEILSKTVPAGAKTK